MTKTDPAAAPAVASAAPKLHAAAIADLAALDTATAGDEGATLHLRHPATGELLHVVLPGASAPVPLTLRLLGADSPTWQNKLAEINRRRLREMRGRRAQLDAAELERAAVELLAAVTAAWSGVVLDGRALPCTEANAVTVYTRLRWVREQADEFVNDRANYLGESARS